MQGSGGTGRPAGRWSAACGGRPPHEAEGDTVHPSPRSEGPCRPAREGVETVSSWLADLPGQEVIQHGSNQHSEHDGLPIRCMARLKGMPRPQASLSLWRLAQRSQSRVGCRPLKNN